MRFSAMCPAESFHEPCATVMLNAMITDCDVLKIRDGGKQDV